MTVMKKGILLPTKPTQGPFVPVMDGLNEAHTKNRTAAAAATAFLGLIRGD